MLWFDVGIKRYTTQVLTVMWHSTLWFDVGIKRYTTLSQNENESTELWFDVGIKRYTTAIAIILRAEGCGLM